MVEKDNKKRSWESNKIVQRFIKRHQALGIDGPAEQIYTHSHEGEWVSLSLDRFYQDNLITEVLYNVKSGKEATVYCCRGTSKSGYPLLAAKVYRPRIFRSLQNDADYTNGRWVKHKRELRAMDNKSRFGREFSFEHWIHNEFLTHQLAHEAGVFCPKPIAIAGNSILMEFVGDEQRSAPLLRNVRLAEDEKKPLFKKIIKAIDKLLSCNRVHGDLSPFNILYWQGKAQLIDFAQSVDPRFNPLAYKLFRRDVDRVCEFFGMESDSEHVANSIWTKHLFPVEGMPIYEFQDYLYEEYDWSNEGESGLN